MNLAENNTIIKLIGILLEQEHVEDEIVIILRAIYLLLEYQTEENCDTVETIVEELHRQAKLSCYLT